MDEERVNALVGAEGAAQALDSVPPPPHVGPVESAAYERDRAERAGYVAAVLAARDAIVGNPHETMRALGRFGMAAARPGMKCRHPGMGTAPGMKVGTMGWGRRRSGWRPGTGGAGAGFGDEIAVCAVCVEEGADFLDGEWCGTGSAHSAAALAHRTLRGDGKSAPGDASTAFAAARDALDLFRALRGPGKTRRRPTRLRRPRRFACTETTAGTSPRDGADRRSPVLGVRLGGRSAHATVVVPSLAAVAVLHASGDAAVTGMLARCKADVFHALDDANGSPISARTARRGGGSQRGASRETRYGKGVRRGFQAAAATPGARLARELLAAYAEKVAAAALALSDVSVDESDSLRGILVEAFDPRGLLVALPGTLASGGGRAAADAEACALVDGLEGDAWMKGSFLPSMLDARLTDLAQWWDEGGLPALGFDVAEVAGVRTRQLRSRREPCRGAGTIGRAVTIGRGFDEDVSPVRSFPPKTNSPRPSALPRVAIRARRLSPREHRLDRRLVLRVELEREHPPVIVHVRGVAKLPEDDSRRHQRLNPAPNATPTLLILAPPCLSPTDRSVSRSVWNHLYPPA